MDSMDSRLASINQDFGLLSVNMDNRIAALRANGSQPITPKNLTDLSQTVTDLDGILKQTGDFLKQARASIGRKESEGQTSDAKKTKRGSTSTKGKGKGKGTGVSLPKKAKVAESSLALQNSFSGIDMENVFSSDEE